ncbi:unnamed protein product [Paramecium sonneborni]|uniref:non-specific serine/threonine protein kinase n=1 Tax=Paramecium sonneborni TaxID=65129 RepID=A0A8S1PX83_9CILI|nr:unnamed protein product [Paramecium sonneborni]
MEKYKRIRKIGKGNFGDVWLVEDNKGRQYAMKRIDLLFDTVDPQNEVSIMKVLKHPNIIKFYDSFEQNDKLCIIMEYAKNSDLSIYIKSKQPDILNYFTQLCLGVQYLHQQKIVHRDIKLRNVFITDDGIIKLGDFSISKKLIDLSTNTTLGTPYYLSPEICQSKNYNSKTDIWNLGCFLYELCTQQKPFLGESLPAILNSIINGQTPQLNETFPKFYQDILNITLQKDPELRPDINYILNIPQIKEQQLKLQVLYKSKGIINRRICPIECPGYDEKKELKQDKQSINKDMSKILKCSITPQYRQTQLGLQNIFSECVSPNNNYCQIQKKPYKKIMTINTQLDEKVEQEVTQKKPSFAKLLFNPKTPTSPNRNILLADFLKNKLGQQVFQRMKDLLENSKDPIQLLENREEMMQILGESNLDCIKIFKILICNSITPPSSHFRTMSASYQFITQRIKTVNNHDNNNNNVPISPWDEQF